MQLHKTNFGFTLIELTIVVVILVVLGSMAVLNVRNCSKVARDSTRITQVNNIQNSLESYAIENLKYPYPDESKAVSFEDSVAFRQGVFGIGLQQQLGNIKEIPVDPLEKTFYVYSKAEKINEFQIGYSLEDDNYVYNLIGEQIFADYKGERIEKVSGNYNGIFIKAGKKLFASASIIIKGLENDFDVESYVDGDGEDVENIAENKKIRVVNDGEFKEFVPIKLADKFPKNQEQQIDFAKKIKKGYKNINSKIKITNKKLEKLLSAQTDEEFYNSSAKIIGNSNIKYKK